MRRRHEIATMWVNENRRGLTGCYVYRASEMYITVSIRKSKTRFYWWETHISTFFPIFEKLWLYQKYLELRIAFSSTLAPICPYMFPFVVVKKYMWKNIKYKVLALARPPCRPYIPTVRATIRDATSPLRPELAHYVTLFSLQCTLLLMLYVCMYSKVWYESFHHNTAKYTTDIVKSTV